MREKIKIEEKEKEGDGRCGRYDGRGGDGHDEVGQREGEGARGVRGAISIKTKRYNKHAVFCACPPANL